MFYRKRINRMLNEITTLKKEIESQSGQIQALCDHKDRKFNNISHDVFFSVPYYYECQTCNKTIFFDDKNEYVKAKNKYERKEVKDKLEQLNKRLEELK